MRAGSIPARAASQVSPDRRQELRRIQDLRQLLLFLQGHGLGVPATAAARLAELGVDPEGKTAAELLERLAAIEWAAGERGPADRRHRVRRVL